MSSQTLLITGGAGFIGSSLVRRALAAGHRVVVIDKLTYAGNLASLAEVASHAAFKFVQADICDAAALRRVFEEHRPSGVLHLAAESHVDRSIDAPADFIATNVAGTFELLQAALRHWRGLNPAQREAFRFVHVSTDEVFGSLGPADRPFDENTAYDPHSPYSASKAASDHLARAWHDTYGLPVVVTNCSNNYGPRQFPEKLVPVVIQKCLRGEPIPVYGRGENVRDWLFVDDHADGLLAALGRGRPGRSYCFGGSNERRNIDLVRLLCGLMDELSPRPDQRSHSEQIAFVEDRPGHDHRYAIDASRARTELGWSPTEDPASGFRKTVRWYLDNRAWVAAVLDGSYRMERLGRI